MKKITLIDDDKILTRHYGEALIIQGFEVTVFHDVKTAISQDHSSCDLLVCDLMMPDDSYFSNIGTRKGLVTGLRLLESIRNDGCTTPCILLTNLNLPAVLEQVAYELEKMQDVILIRKSEFDPIEFAGVVLGLMNKSAWQSLAPGLGKRIIDSIIIKAPIIPGFLTIDLKKLFDKQK